MVLKSQTQSYKTYKTYIIFYNQKLVCIYMYFSCQSVKLTAEKKLFLLFYIFMSFIALAPGEIQSKQVSCCTIKKCHSKQKKNLCWFVSFYSCKVSCFSHFWKNNYFRLCTLPIYRLNLRFFAVWNKQNEAKIKMYWVIKSFKKCSFNLSFK